MKDSEKKLLSVMDYPFVIRKELDRIVVHSPDLEVTYGELPIPQHISPSERKTYYQKLGLAVIRAWQKGEVLKTELIKQGKNVPEPSKDPFPTRHLSGRYLSPAQIAKMAGCHKDTVRRAIDSGKLPSDQTPGGLSPTFSPCATSSGMAMRAARSSLL